MARCWAVSSRSSSDEVLVTDPIENSPARRSAWRRPWPWIAISVAVLVAVALVIGFLMSSANNNSAQSPDGLLSRVIHRTNDTAVTAGGVWTFEDKSPWVPGDTSGYTGVPCGDEDAGPQQYPIHLNSAGVADPASLAAKVATHWKSLGYSVRTVVPPQADNSDFTQIAADLENGARLVYSVSKKISGIDALSECSSDAAMRNTTK